MSLTYKIYGEVSDAPPYSTLAQEAVRLLADGQQISFWFETPEDGEVFAKLLSKYASQQQGKRVDAVAMKINAPVATVPPQAIAPFGVYTTPN